jgi:hypothetical protein
MKTSDVIPKVIPPKSIVRLVRADSKTPEFANHIGERFRVGYYSRQDGLNCIWLVDKSGNYVQTIDRVTLLNYFELDEISDEQDYYGVDRPPIGTLE